MLRSPLAAGSRFLTPYGLDMYQPRAERAGTCLKGSCSQLFMRSFGLDLAEERAMLSDTFEAAFSCTNVASTWHIFPFWCHYSTMSNVSTTLQLSKG